MNGKVAILTDLDNTLYNWVDFFAPSFRAMVHVLARESGVEEEAIYLDFKEVFSAHGSLEYAFSVQRLRLCVGRSHDDVANLVRMAKGAFSRVREKNLDVYPGVKETLEWARNQGIAVVGVTNSPIFQARRRLSQLHIDHLFTGLAAWEGPAVPDDDPWAEPVRERAREGGWQTRLEREWKFAEAVLKPNPKMYQAVLEDLRIEPTSAWVVGDSLKKDVHPALQIGAMGVWARYGQQFDRKNFETLLLITPWSERRIAETYDEEAIRPPFVIDSFGELLNYVPPYQGSLF